MEKIVFLALLGRILVGFKGQIGWILKLESWIRKFAALHLGSGDTQK